MRKHGVCLYLRRSINFVVVDTRCDNVCCVHLMDFDVYVVVIYRPPSNDEACNVSLCSFLLEFCGSKEVLLMGDFNLPSVPWSSRNLFSLSYPALQQRFLDCFVTLGLTQWVKLPTFLHSENILDLVLTSEEDRLGGCLLYTSPSPRDKRQSRMPSSA